MLSNDEIDEIMLILEEMEDESLSRELLKQFSDASAHYGRLILNLDQDLEHEEWKKLTDQALVDLRSVIARIKSER
jgi:hypothetical protein